VRIAAKGKHVAGAEVVFAKDEIPGVWATNGPRSENPNRGKPGTKP
jgi:hypothetical protein